MFLDEIGKYLWAHAPAVCVLTTIIVIVFILSWKMFRLYGRLEKVEDSCKNIDSINQSTLHISNKVDKISTDLQKLFIYLSGQSKEFPKEFFTSHSPIFLNDLGRSLLEKSGGKKYIDQNLDNLITSLHSDNNFKSALDVQTSSQKILLSFIDTDGFTPVKNYIFNNPVIKIGEGENTSELNFGLNLAINIMSIYLRDKYFDLYPNLKDVEPNEQEPQSAS